MMAGLHEGELTIVAARPGMGKTSFVLNMAAHVAAPRAVGQPAHQQERLLLAVANGNYHSSFWGHLRQQGRRQTAG